MSDDNVMWLDGFYSRLCNGEWEHSYGFDIGTLDNPGWSIDFDLAHTKLEHAAFVPLKEERSEHDWIFCSVKDRKFLGQGGAGNLSELLRIFRSWTEAHIGPGDSPWP